VRSFGPRPLIEDNTVRSNASTIVSARVGFRLSYGLAFGLEALNLFSGPSWPFLSSQSERPNRGNRLGALVCQRLPGRDGELVAETFETARFNHSRTSP